MMIIDASKAKDMTLFWDHCQVCRVLEELQIPERWSLRAFRRTRQGMRITECYRALPIEHLVLLQSAPGLKFAQSTRTAETGVHDNELHVTLEQMELFIRSFVMCL